MSGETDILENLRKQAVQLYETRDKVCFPSKIIENIDILVREIDLKAGIQRGVWIQTLRLHSLKNIFQDTRTKSPGF
jgi:hypothetical protein